jgi:hypothetical protein
MTPRRHVRPVTLLAALVLALVVSVAPPAAAAPEGQLTYEDLKLKSSPK